MKKTTSILLIRPYNFYFNKETAINNYFQKEVNIADVAEKAQQEFDKMVEMLKEKNIDLVVIQDSPSPETPDSIFPNNWISFHEDNSICLYPMFAENRRLERKPEVFKKLNELFIINKVNNLTEFENENIFLEGTGSLILDRENRIAYAGISVRTHPSALKKWRDTLDYKIISFTIKDRRLQPIYHTNVMMCVGDKFAVVCLNSIINSTERNWVVNELTRTQKEIIEISLEQMENFAGNMLQVYNRDGVSFLIMSKAAYTCLNSTQIQKLEKYAQFVCPEISTIETLGGGSVRCMMAEILNDKK